MLILLRTLTCALALSANAQRSAPPTDSSFLVSSETSDYRVRGTVDGTYVVSDSMITVTVVRGSLLSDSAQATVRIQAFIGVSSDSVWQSIATSGKQEFGPFHFNERKTIQRTMTFVIPKPPAFNPKTHWLGFMFWLSPTTNTVACSAVTFDRSNAYTPEREKLLQRNYWEGC